MSTRCRRSCAPLHDRRLTEPRSRSGGTSGSSHPCRTSPSEPDHKTICQRGGNDSIHLNYRYEGEAFTKPFTRPEAIASLRPDSLPSRATRSAAMDLRQLEALLAVAEAGSFTAAADQLHTVQSNVSEHVRQLESEL